MTRARIIVAAVTVAVLLVLSGGQRLGAQDAGGPQFPAAAVIRGENIRLRLEPAAQTTDVAILERGDEVTITGEATSADGLTFYPVEVVATGEAGWVRTLFIDPKSIAPLIELPPAQQTEVVPVPVEATESTAQEDRQARRERRNRQAQETPVTETPVAEAPVVEAPVVVEPAPAEAPATEAPAGEAATDAGTISVSGEGTSTSAPVALEAGRYRVRATLEASAASTFTVDLLGPAGFTEVLFDDQIDEAQTWITRTSLTLDVAGEYTVNVSGTDDPWVIEFVPR